MNRLEQLTEALQWLAAAPKEQIRLLGTLGMPTNIDELALQYDSIAAAAPDMLRKGELNKIQSDRVTELNTLLDAMSGRNNAELWTANALESSSHWQRVRDLARECLILLSSR